MRARARTFPRIFLRRATICPCDATGRSPISIYFLFFFFFFFLFSFSAGRFFPLVSYFVKIHIVLGTCPYLLLWIALKFSPLLGKGPSAPHAPNSSLSLPPTFSASPTSPSAVGRHICRFRHQRYIKVIPSATKAWEREIRCTIIPRAP